MAACVNKHIMEFAKRDGRPKLIHTYNYNFSGVPWQFLKRMGFERNPIGPVQTDFGVLPVWSHLYNTAIPSL